ncbi:hypothetical protein PR048_020433 [Dryococelus australis]|uniref:Uncharacterized protein n=1 Tax=Dryococelus australis TaxID=614101 RepID=A0ABQ9H6A6_9NEOP|nr:hypothetical protein PR048_020433 [Dryococelus australis]
MIGKEPKELDNRGEGGSLHTPGKRRKTRPEHTVVNNINDFDLCVIRRTIQDFDIQEKRVPAIAKLLSVVKERGRILRCDDVVSDVIDSIVVRLDDSSDSSSASGACSSRSEQENPGSPLATPLPRGEARGAPSAVRWLLLTSSVSHTLAPSIRLSAIPAASLTFPSRVFSYKCSSPARPSVQCSSSSARAGRRTSGFQHARRPCYALKGRNKGEGGALFDPASCRSAKVTPLPRCTKPRRILTVKESMGEETELVIVQRDYSVVWREYSVSGWRFVAHRNPKYRLFTVKIFALFPGSAVNVDERRQAQGLTRAALYEVRCEWSSGNEDERRYRTNPEKNTRTKAVSATRARNDGNTAHLARRSDEAPEVRVSVARIAPSRLDLGLVVPTGDWLSSDTTANKDDDAAVIMAGHTQVAEQQIFVARQLVASFSHSRQAAHQSTAPREVDSHFIVNSLYQPMHCLIESRADAIKRCLVNMGRTCDDSTAWFWDADKSSAPSLRFAGIDAERRCEISAVALSLFTIDQDVTVTVFSSDGTQISSYWVRRGYCDSSIIAVVARLLETFVARVSARSSSAHWVSEARKCTAKCFKGLVACIRDVLEALKLIDDCAQTTHSGEERINQKLYWTKVCTNVRRTNLEHQTSVVGSALGSSYRLQPRLPPRTIVAGPWNTLCVKYVVAGPWNTLCAKYVVAGPWNTLCAKYVVAGPWNTLCAKYVVAGPWNILCAKYVVAGPWNTLCAKYVVAGPWNTLCAKYVVAGPWNTLCVKYVVAGPWNTLCVKYVVAGPWNILCVKYVVAGPWNILCVKYVVAGPWNTLCVKYVAAGPWNTLCAKYIAAGPWNTLCAKYVVAGPWNILCVKYVVAGPWNTLCVKYVVAGPWNILCVKYVVAGPWNILCAKYAVAGPWNILCAKYVVAGPWNILCVKYVVAGPWNILCVKYVVAGPWNTLCVKYVVAGPWNTLCVKYVVAGPWNILCVKYVVAGPWNTLCVKYVVAGPWNTLCSWTAYRHGNTNFPAGYTRAAVVQWSHYSPPAQANRIPSPAKSLRDFLHVVGIVPDDAAGRRVFPGISRSTPPLHSGAAPCSPCNLK